MTKGVHISDQGRILVIGGRIAGLTVAALLAAKGEDVVVVERRKLGAPTVSIALVCPDTLAIFDEFGFGRVLDDGDFTRVTSLSFELLPGVRLDGPFPSSFGRSWGYAIRREHLDLLLQQHVVSCFPRVEWVDRFTIQEFLFSGNRACGVRGMTSDGQVREIRADLVVGADGKLSPTAKAMSAEILETVDVRTCFYYAYFQRRVSFHGTGALSTYHGTTPYPSVAFAQDAENGLIGVGIQTSPALFRYFSREPAGALQEALRALPALQEKLAETDIVSRVYGMLVPPMQRRKVHGPGWALAGDAAVHINPITGQGVSFAARAAKWLSEAVKAWRNSDDSKNAFEAYGLRISEEFADDFERAAAAADIDAPIEPWRQQFYSAFTRSEDCRTLWLQMLTNAISINEFNQKSGILAAEQAFRSNYLVRKHWKP